MLHSLRISLAQSPGLTGRGSPPSLSLAFVGLALAVLCFFTDTTKAHADDYLQELIQRANTVALHDQRYWHLLLHYRRTIGGGYESEADEAGFFLAPKGKTDPKAELQATLARFFSTELVGRSRQPARCAFIARYHWLKAALAIDESRLPPEPCERFHAWLRELNPASITLVFPSAYMNNPSSMFGHLLLRIDQRGQTEQTRILAYTVNYSADVTTNNGIVFAVLGVAGGFKGYFSTHPYYVKAKEYGDFENRDIWEYRLNLTEDQVERLLMHTWEMGNASFDYFFFKENCAYQILSLLDVADPDLHLTDRFWLYTFPSDGVRMIAEKPGLVKEIIFRPSRSTKIRRGRQALSGDEKMWLGKITADPSLAQSEPFTIMPPQRQALVLDVASDYLLYRAATEGNDATSYQERNKAVLIARSKLKVLSVPVALTPVTGPPEQGHNVMRAGLGLGWHEREFFNELNFRLAFHDLFDPEYGYTPDAQIEAMDVALRHYARSDHTRLERFTLVNIVSLSPMDALFKSPSWKVSTGLETIEHNQCRFCRIGNLNTGIGAAAESFWLKREVYFGFAELASEYGRVFNSNYRLGGGATLGTLVDITERWKFGVSGTYLQFPLGEKSHEWRVSAQQRYALHKNFAVRFEFNQRARTQEYLLNLHAYF
ncbi:MAG: DUF4105 domain-containing protein [Deltaproteobacteria bacterium]|nr:MAG: DUF4105 domain-containing protein [Deltaproteobacteria bacterium]